MLASQWWMLMLAFVSRKLTGYQMLFQLEISLQTFTSPCQEVVKWQLQPFSDIALRVGSSNCTMLLLQVYKHRESYKSLKFILVWIMKIWRDSRLYFKVKQHIGLPVSFCWTKANISIQPLPSKHYNFSM